jgi:hypothetical protein
VNGEKGMMNKIVLLINTIKYLNLKQIYYRGYYLIRKKIKGFDYPLSLSSSSRELGFDMVIYNSASYKGDNEFEFLNLSKKFDDTIDWNYKEYGKLWTYNLTYFDYLNQKEITKEEGVKLIYDFIDNLQDVQDGLEPFAISLRGINWIKFLTRYEIKDQKIDDALYAQYYILLDNLEYHLLGNHLLENGFSLLFGAYYFDDDKLYSKAKEILTQELQEQILDDGGHFELSPMYHQLMLFRVLESVNIMENGKWRLENGELIEFLKEKATVMLGWLRNMTFANGDIPLLNDSATKIAPTSSELFEYANKLLINHHSRLTPHHSLKTSSYRKIVKNNYECIVDIGQIGPDYIPGHAHADTFNFILYTKSPLTTHHSPFITDTGISTYDIGIARDYERSTKAHNTVEINSTNSSEVWGGFRVANRAEVINVEEKEDYIKATHNGYEKKFGIVHTREWNFKEDKIIIKDTLNKKADAVFRLHFDDKIDTDEILQKVSFDERYKIVDSYVAKEYNQKTPIKVLEIYFDLELKVEIKI